MFSGNPLIIMVPRGDDRRENVAAVPCVEIA